MAGLQWLCGMLTQKANTSGYYPNMSVGEADTCGAGEQTLGIRPINPRPIDLQPIDRQPIDLQPIEQEPIEQEPEDPEIIEETEGK